MTEPHCSHHPHDAGSGIPQPGRKLLVVSAVFIFVFLISFLDSLAPLHQSLLAYLGLVWWAVLLGLILGGMIDYFVPDTFIMRFLGQHRKRSILYAMFGGVVMSACSHGMLAIAMQLYKKGAGTGPVMTFLLASPWANLPITILLFSFFGWQAFLIIAAALLIAGITGLIYNLLEPQSAPADTPGHVEENLTDWHRVTDFNLKSALTGMFAGTMSLANMVLWWILIGILVAALIGAYVPSHVFMNYFNAEPGGVLLTLLAATVIEVCSEGSAPVAFELYDNLGVIGNSFVFLMAGVATDYTEIGLIWSNIGRRAALLLPLITVPQVVIIGLMFNKFVT